MILYPTHCIAVAAYSRMADFNLSKPGQIMCQRIDSDYITFLKQATVNFTLEQRNVIVQMDEIHVKSDQTYKGGKMIELSGSLNEPTRTVLALMVSSLYKKWSTIVRLIPCSTTTAESLFPTTERNIRGNEFNGFKFMFCARITIL